jgi:hypothetical protein
MSYSFIRWGRESHDRSLEPRMYRPMELHLLPGVWSGWILMPGTDRWSRVVPARCRIWTLRGSEPLDFGPGHGLVVQLGSPWLNPTEGCREPDPRSSGNDPVLVDEASHSIGSS